MNNSSWDGFVQRSARILASCLAFSVIALVMTISLPIQRHVFAQQSLNARWTATSEPQFKVGTMTRLHNGKVIAVGVTSPIGNLLSKVEIYDPFTDTWRETASLNYPRYGHTTLLLFDGRVLVVGGTRNELGVSTPLPAGPPEIFDPATEKWSVMQVTGIASPESINMWLRSNIRLLPNGEVMVLSQVYNNTYIFNSSTGNVRQVESPRTNLGSSFPSSLDLPNGKVLFLSGENSNSNAEIFDPATGSWTTVASPAFDGYPLLGKLAANLPNGKLLALLTVPTNQRVSAVFDPQSGSWTNLTLRNIFNPATATLLNGEVLGFDTGSAEIYSNNSAKWRTANAPARHALGSILLANGQVFTGNELYGTDFGSSNLPIAVATSASSFHVEPLATGSIASIFGANLSASTALDSASIAIKDQTGVEYPVNRVFAVTPNQVNFQVPEISSGEAEVIITNRATGNRSRSLISITGTSPGIFTANADGRGVPAATLIRIKQDGTQVYEPVSQYDAAIGRAVPIAIDAGAAGEQVFLVLFGTGWKNRLSEQNAVVYIGGVRTEVQYVGAQGSFDGLDQMNILLPKSLSGKGEVDVLVSVDGKKANPVQIKFK